MRRMRAVFVGGSSGIGLAAATRAVGRRLGRRDREPRSRAAPRSTPRRWCSTSRTTAAVRTDVRGARPDRPPRLRPPWPGPAAPPRSSTSDAARRRVPGEALGPLRRRPGGLTYARSIVFVSGVAAATPTRGGSATAAVNGAIEALVRTLAVELAPVRVNAISPGIIDTPTWDAYGQRPTVTRCSTGSRARFPLDASARQTSGGRDLDAAHERVRHRHHAAGGRRPPARRSLTLFNGKRSWDSRIIDRRGFFFFFKKKKKKKKRGGGTAIRYQVTSCLRALGTSRSASRSRRSPSAAGGCSYPALIAPRVPSLTMSPAMNLDDRCGGRSSRAPQASLDAQRIATGS